MTDRAGVLAAVAARTLASGARQPAPAASADEVNATATGFAFPAPATMHGLIQPFPVT
jgi:hypothetical protein